MGQRQSAPDNSSQTEKRIATSATPFIFQSSSINAPLIEEAPLHPHADDAADQSVWNDVGVPVQTSEEDEAPVDPIVYDGARAANATRRKNVILFGETGVGKSSVINLIAGTEVAKTSSDLEGCTMEATEYAFTLSGHLRLCMYDTVGLNEPEMGVNTFFGAIDKANRLIKSLHHAGGVDLLLFCVRGNRITGTTQRNYRLFFEFLCEKKVPLALVVTSLEYVDVMEDWWNTNKTVFDKYGVHSVAHACVTAAPARSPMLIAKRTESRSVLHKMLHDTLSSNPTPYAKDIQTWLINLMGMIRSFFVRNLPASLRKKALLSRLQKDCGLSADAAQGLADMLTQGG